MAREEHFGRPHHSDAATAKQPPELDCTHGVVGVGARARQLAPRWCGRFGDLAPKPIWKLWPASFVPSR